MRVVLVNTWHDPSLGDFAALLAADPLRRELARGLADRGHAVTVVQEHRRPGRHTDGAVTWELVAPSPLTRGARALLTRGGRGVDALPRSPTDALVRAVARLRPEVVHTFDLPFPFSTWQLTRLGVPVVAHFHGGAPARVAGLPALERVALGRLTRALFTTADHAAPWIAAGLRAEAVVEVFESSSVFRPGPAPRLPGHPALLHTGRLDPVKDPLTTLAGLRRALPHLPGAALTLAWRDAPLIDEVRRAATGLPVHLLGRVEDPEPLYRGADVFVQASLREVCGMAAVEALACGTPVVLSDIPSFRRLTDGGRVGALFPVGDADALARALVHTTRAGPGRAEVRAHFEATLSFAALSDAVDAVYRGLRAGPAPIRRSPTTS